MRCLALADAVSGRGIESHFICRDLPGHLGTRIVASGHGLSLLPPGVFPLDPLLDAEACRRLLVGRQTPELLVVDHYGLDATWEDAMRATCKGILAIDDLADRDHRVDVLIDASPGRREADYRSHTLATTTFLAGPSYALLRPEFARHRDASLAKDRSALKRLLVAMGGMDAGNATRTVLEVLAGHLPGPCDVEVLLGETAPWLEDVRSLAHQLPFPCRVLSGVADVAEILGRVDLAIGAAGVSALERCALGVPSLLVLLADNQEAGARYLTGVGAARLLGEASEVATRLPRELSDMARPGALEAMSRQCRTITDGHGIERALSAIAAAGFDLDPDVAMRSMTLDDLDTVFTWRNDARVRAAMHSQAPIGRDEHDAWFRRLSEEPGRLLLILEVSGRPSGFVNLSPPDPSGAARWGFYAAPGAPKGTGRLLGREGLRVAFGSAGIDEVHAEVLAGNAASARFHERLGFTRAGRPEAGGANGQNCGNILHYVLRKEDHRP